MKSIKVKKMCIIIIVALIILGCCLYALIKPLHDMKMDYSQKFQDSVQQCKNSGLTDWELVEYVQGLVNRNMKYSITNSLDSPMEAFERGQGYCWHQASAVNMLLHELGFESRLVHAMKNFFKDIEIEGAHLKEFESGHVWCRVTIDGVEKDVCPGSANNKPGVVHFQTMSEVLEWNSWYEFWNYYGSALVNSQHIKEFEKLKDDRHEN